MTVRVFSSAGMVISGNEAVDATGQAGMRGKESMLKYAIFYFVLGSAAAVLAGILLWFMFWRRENVYRQKRENMYTAQLKNQAAVLDKTKRDLQRYIREAEEYYQKTCRMDQTIYEMQSQNYQNEVEIYNLMARLKEAGREYDISKKEIENINRESRERIRKLQASIIRKKNIIKKLMEDINKFLNEAKRMDQMEEGYKKLETENKVLEQENAELKQENEKLTLQNTHMLENLNIFIKKANGLVRENEYLKARFCKNASHLFYTDSRKQVLFPAGRIGQVQKKLSDCTKMEQFLEKENGRQAEKFLHYVREYRKETEYFFTTYKCEEESDASREYTKGFAKVFKDYFAERVMEEVYKTRNQSPVFCGKFARIIRDYLEQNHIYCMKYENGGMADTAKYEVQLARTDDPKQHSKAADVLRPVLYVYYAKNQKDSAMCLFVRGKALVYTNKQNGDKK